jgi:hypothetical protein
MIFLTWELLSMTPSGGSTQKAQLHWLWWMPK